MNSLLKSKFSLPLFLLCLSTVFLSGLGCTSVKEKITIVVPQHSKVLDYAEGELSGILKKQFNVTLAGVLDRKGWNIVLKADSGMKPFSFSVINSKDEKKRTIILSGHDETCVRTYENRLAVRYASEAMIEGPIPSQTFYNSISKRLGIANPEKYASAMSKLDETDTFCRDKLFNIGFCPNGYWLKKNGLSLYGRYNLDNLVTAIDRFTDVRNDLKDCIQGTKNITSKKDLLFLENRVGCTILHLKAFVKMKEIQPLFQGNPDPVLSLSDREKVLNTLRETLSLEKQYLDLHAEFIPDRGSEGTFVSYMGGPYQCLKDIIAKYTSGIDGTAKTEKSFDAPPEPGQSKSNINN